MSPNIGISSIRVRKSFFETCEIIPNITNNFQFGCISSATNFWPSLAPCRLAMVARSRHKNLCSFLAKLKVIPIAENKDIFELRQSCRDSTIVNGIVLIQYNAIYDRRIPTLSRAQICIYFLRLVLISKEVSNVSRRFALSYFI